jgi:sulfatase maturation enzyme AslB (radical SAM superfamily)
VCRTLGVQAHSAHACQQPHPHPATVAPRYLPSPRRCLPPSGAERSTRRAPAHTDLLTRLETASILYLVLVQDCNFACSYCPIPDLAGKHGRQRMTAATARLAVDMWADHISADPIGGEYCAILYGGEPLLNLPTLVAAVNHIETLQRERRLPARERLSLMVCTNGYLVDDSFAEFCRQHRISVTVGCDGPKETHDPIRRTTQDQDTFDLVLKGIHTLVGAGVTTFASTSITPSNIDHLDRLPDFFRDLGVAKYGLNFLRGQLLFRLVSMAELPDYYEKATNGVLDNLRTANENLEYQLERKVMTYLERRFFPTDCNGYGNQLVVDPHGRVGNCPFLAGNTESAHSAPDGFRISATPQAQQWRATCRPAS